MSARHTESFDRKQPLPSPPSGGLCLWASLSAAGSGRAAPSAIARGIVNSPAILLADEPTGNLDSENSGAVLKLMKDLNQRLGQTILMITHDADAASYADRIVKMRDGRIV